MRKYLFIVLSGAGSKNVDPNGYYFYTDDYIKLNMMNYTINKDASPQTLISKLK